MSITITYLASTGLPATVLQTYGDYVYNGDHATFRPQRLLTKDLAAWNVTVLELTGITPVHVERQGFSKRSTTIAYTQEAFPRALAIHTAMRVLNKRLRYTARRLARHPEIISSWASAVQLGLDPKFAGEKYMQELLRKGGGG